MKTVLMTIYHDPFNSNKVSAIKAWRTITGIGLKESKDFIDTIFQHGFGGRTKVVLNMAQYGELQFLKHSGEMEQSGLSFVDVVRYEVDTVNDFSKFSVN